MLLIPAALASRAVRPTLAQLVCLVRGHDYVQRWHWLKLKTCQRCGRNRPL